MMATDTPLPEDEAIAAAHPVRTARHDLYAEAMRLVGARYSKAGLVELVNWLLHERDQLRAALLRHVGYCGGRRHHVDDCPRNEGDHCEGCDVCDLVEEALR